MSERLKSSNPISPEQLFQKSQDPVFWLYSAERLVAAAEIILCDQLKQEIPFFRAVDEADEYAQALALDAEDGMGVAEIMADAPNYVPAQLLYAFAIENALKGLLVSHNPGLKDTQRLSRKLKTHDLQSLAAEAGVELFIQEVPIAKVLSSIAEWAGRYPVAVDRVKHEGVHPFGPNSEALLDWGSQHPIMRQLAKRLIKKLNDSLDRQPTRCGVVISTRPKTS